MLIERKPKIIHFQIHCNRGRFYSRKWHQPEHVAFCLIVAVVAKKNSWILTIPGNEDQLVETFNHVHVDKTKPLFMSVLNSSVLFPIHFTTIASVTCEQQRLGTMEMKPSPLVLYTSH